MPDNSELKESVDLMGTLREQAKGLAKDSDTQKEIYEIISDTQKKIVKDVQTQTEEQKKLKSIQTDISGLAKEIAEEYERLNHGSADALENLRSLHEKIGEKLVEESKQQQAIGKQEEFRANIVMLLNRAGLEKAVDYYKQMNQLWQSNPMVAVLAGSLDIIKKIISVFDNLDKAAADFRISMGFTRESTSAIEGSARETYFQLAQSGLTIDKIYESFKSIEKSVGTTQAASQGMTADMGLLNVQLGVATDTSAEFAKAMAMMGRSTLEAQRDLTLFATKLSEAGGTNLSDVMNDVANATKSSYQFITRSPVALLKAAVEARRMGTSISDAAKSAQSLVNFTESVQSEMNASVLLGEAINLQRARELAYRKDLAGLNKEILDIAKKARFEELDPFQQKAVADALGKSADELGKMLQSDREMAKIRANPALREQVALYDKLETASQSLIKSTAEDQRLKISTLSNQKAITAVTAAWGAIWQRVLEGPVTLLTHILPHIANALGNINYYMGKWGMAISTVLGGLTLIIGAKGLGKLVGWATGGIGKAITNLFGGTAEGVKKFGGPGVLKGAFGMLVVAASLIPLALALKIASGVNWKTVAIMGASLVGLAVIAGIIGAPPIAALVETGAFVLLTLGAAALVFAGSAYIFSAAIKSLDGVNIPKIATGIASLGMAIIPLSLIAPMLPLVSIGLGMFSIALRFAAGPAERMGKAAEMLGQGLQTTVSSLVALKGLDFSSTLKQLKDLSVVISSVSKSVQEIPDIKVEKLQNIVIKAAEVGASQESKSTDDILKALDTIRAAVDNLRSSMERGGIAANVIIDSQKLDSAAARRLSFTGPLSPQTTF